MKIVTKEISKWSKENGYPQNIGVSSKIWYHSKETSEWILKDYLGGDINMDDYFSAPTYLELWNWLWKEKNVRIGLHPDTDIMCSLFFQNSSHPVLTIPKDKNSKEDPEEYIIMMINEIYKNGNL